MIRPPKFRAESDRAAPDAIAPAPREPAPHEPGLLEPALDETSLQETVVQETVVHEAVFEGTSFHAAARQEPAKHERASEIERAPKAEADPFFQPSAIPAERKATVEAVFPDALPLPPAPETESMRAEHTHAAHPDDELHEAMDAASATLEAHPEETPQYEPAADHRQSDDEAPPEENLPHAEVIGRYEANGTHYIMYADGSIDAETAHGAYRFSSMDELKRFIEGEQ